MRNENDNNCNHGCGGFISYDKEVQEFYKNTIAIENFVEAVDSKVGSNLHVKFRSLNFEKLAITIAQESKREVNLIEARVNEKKREAQSELTNFNQKLDELNKLILKALEKKVDTRKFKDSFCYIKHNKPATDLISKERFQDFIDESKVLQKNIQQNIDELNNLLKKSQNKFFLWEIIDKLYWQIESFLC